MSGNICGLCGQPVYRALIPYYAHTRWRHVDTNHDEQCAWGHPSKPGIHLRDTESEQK